MMNSQGNLPQRLALIFGITVAASIVLGGLAVWLGDPVTFKADLWDAIWPRLQVMLVVALVIERAVEMYLYGTGQNGPDRFLEQTEKIKAQLPATKAATVAAVALGILVALVGVRILDAILGSPLTGFHSWLWTGVDVIISAGLLAGGSALIHEIMELLRGGLNVGGRALKREKTASVTGLAVERAAEYQITVKRTGADSGTLTFDESGVSVNATCWWDSARKISAGTYAGCSATRMATKVDSVTGNKRPGIFLPTAVAPDTGANTIFIHEGKDASWSDGCIVLNRDDMMRMWNIIEKDSQNVTVQVIDS